VGAEQAFKEFADDSRGSGSHELFGSEPLNVVARNGRIRDRDRERTSLQANAICNSSDGVPATDWPSADRTRVKRVITHGTAVRVCRRCAVLLKAEMHAKAKKYAVQGRRRIAETIARYALHVKAAETSGKASSRVHVHLDPQKALHLGVESLGCPSSRVLPPRLLTTYSASGLGMSPAPFNDRILRGHQVTLWADSKRDQTAIGGD
jgi:hypothetical protein